MLPYLIVIGITALLFASFLILTRVEHARGIRLLAGPRDRFDVRVMRAEFILKHVDWGAFIGDMTRTGLERALHDVAHGMLQSVRLMERVLTRVVRALRMRQELPEKKTLPLLESARTYVQTTITRARAPRKMAAPQEPPDVVEL